ncbi:MAG TPA: hypothetical protein VL574_01030 [Stellaceae bacterium]|nr:hypothetical protein [Stellaceae bacterium]
MMVSTHLFRNWTGRYGRWWLSIATPPLLWGFFTRNYNLAAMGAIIAWVGVWGLLTRANPDNTGPLYLRRGYLVAMLWLLPIAAAAGIWDMSLGNEP